MTIQDQAQEFLKEMKNYSQAHTAPMRSIAALHEVATGKLEGDFLIAVNGGMHGSWPEVIPANDGSFETEEQLFGAIGMLKEAGSAILSYRFEGRESIVEVAVPGSSYFVTKKYQS